MGAGAIQPNPLPRHLLAKGLQKQLQTTRIHARQEQEETLTAARLNCGRAPAPLVTIRHDPGRPHPNRAPAPPEPDFEPEAAFSHRPDPAQIVVPHEPAEVGFYKPLAGRYPP